MDRAVVYSSAIPTDSDILQPQQNAMVALGYALKAAYGTNTVIVGLQCTPTAPASMQITVGPGGIIAQDVVESTPYGSIVADTGDPLTKMGINITSTSFTMTMPSTAGQSQNYLIQCAFSEADDSPATLAYYNSLNPSQPFTGPANSGTPQNTRRAQRASLVLKVGTPQNAGSQLTPTVDPGYIGLWVITVANGQTSITASSISPFANAPFLVPFLSKHHLGVPGSAPKIDLANEVQGILSAANLPGAVGSATVFAGNPNGHVAGSAASGTTPPTMCWDTVSLEWWTCVTTGTTTTAVWAYAQNATKNIQGFNNNSTFVVPAGVTRVKVMVVGGGGGGGGVTSVGAGLAIASPGGQSAAWGSGYYTVTPGSSIAVTVGAGGAGGTSGGGSGGTGGTSSFGSLLSAPGGTGAAAMSASTSLFLVQAPPINQNGPSGSNIAFGVTTVGSPAMGSSGNVVGGGGGNGPFGGGGPNPIGSFGASNGWAGFANGAGGSGGASGAIGGSGAAAGGAGAVGIVIVEW
jgi:hypothetical protein